MQEATKYLGALVYELSKGQQQAVIEAIEEAQRDAFEAGFSYGCGEDEWHPEENPEEEQH